MDITDTPQVVLGSLDSDHVAITVVHRERPDDQDYWDGNWVIADVSIAIHPWRGTYQANLRTTEFVGFRKGVEELYANAADTAKFEPIEPWLHLELTRDSLGRVSVSGEAAPEGGGRIFGAVRLKFTLENWIDQTYLPPIIHQLQEIERAFPVRGAPGAEH